MSTRQKIILALYSGILFFGLSNTIAQETIDCSELCSENLVNGSFESPVITINKYVLTDEDSVAGWQTTASDGKIEMWPSGYVGLLAAEGNQFVEINSNFVSALFQELCLLPGTVINWSAKHKGKFGLDVATVRIGADFETAEIQQTMSDNKNAWGSYQGQYTVPPTQHNTIFIFEVVSAARGNLQSGNFIDDVVITVVSSPDCTDTDNDGVYNVFDEYPEDPTKVFNNYYPAKDSFATLAFEDLWPFLGDYDFNDTVIEYNINTITDSENKVKEVVFTINTTHVGGGLINAFGIAIPGLDKNNILSVTGQQLNENVFNVLSNGIENGQTNVVVPIFDNDFNAKNQNITVTLTLQTAVASTSISAPFNPFLVKGGDRSQEIHLPDKAMTDLGEILYTDSPTHEDLDGNYLSNNGLPWAINIVDTFVVPKEKTPINEAYLFFNEWATSGGSQKQDWFRDKANYRSLSKLQIN